MKFWHPEVCCENFWIQYKLIDTNTLLSMSIFLFRFVWPKLGVIFWNVFEQEKTTSHFPQVQLWWNVALVLHKSFPSALVLHIFFLKHPSCTITFVLHLFYTFHFALRLFYKIWRKRAWGVRVDLTVSFVLFSIQKCLRKAYFFFVLDFFCKMAGECE